MDTKHIELQETQADSFQNSELDIEQNQIQEQPRIIDIRLHSLGRIYANGFSSCYESDYRQELQGLMSQKQFEEMINDINFTIQALWSCGFCHYFGWVLAIPTLGLSFLCPRICQSEAEAECQIILDRYNNGILRTKRLRVTLRKQLFRSYLHIQSYNPFEEEQGMYNSKRNKMANVVYSEINTDIEQL